MLSQVNFLPPFPTGKGSRGVFSRILLQDRKDKCQDPGFSSLRVEALTLIMPSSFSVSQGAQHLGSQQLRIASQSPSTWSLPDPNTDSPALLPLVCPMHRVALSTGYCFPTTPAPL